MQLIVQNVDLLEFSKWTMAVYDEQEEKLSDSFFISKPVCDSLGNPLLRVLSKDKKGEVDSNTIELLKKLCKSNSVKLVIGTYSYSCNKSEVKKLFSYLKKRARYSVINHGILLYREKCEIPNYRLAELVLI